MTVTCSYCQQPFGIKPYRMARNVSGLIFCSKSCRERDGRTTGNPPTKLAPLTCPICGASFHRKQVERLAVNYCSYSCAARGTGNLKPAPKGARHSPATEFQPGREAENRAPLGTVRIRKRRNRNDERAFVKIAEPNIWRLRALVAYEEAFGLIPEGLVIHHVNHDRLDDRPENLVALSRAAHLDEHRPDHQRSKGRRKT